MRGANKTIRDRKSDLDIARSKINITDCSFKVKYMDSEGRHSCLPNMIAVMNTELCIFLYHCIAKLSKNDTFVTS